MVPTVMAFDVTPGALALSAAPAFPPFPPTELRKPRTKSRQLPPWSKLECCAYSSCRPPVDDLAASPRDVGLGGNWGPTKPTLSEYCVGESTLGEPGRVRNRRFCDLLLVLARWWWKSRIRTRCSTRESSSIFSTRRRHDTIDDSPSVTQLRSGSAGHQPVGTGRSLRTPRTPLSRLSL